MLCCASYLVNVDSLFHNKFLFAEPVLYVQYKIKKVNVAHREGRTRSLQMIQGSNPPKSLTLYPIELGGL